MFSVFRRWPSLRRIGVAVCALPLMFAGGSLISDFAARSVGEVGSLEIPYREFDALYRTISGQYLNRYNISELTPELAQNVSGQARARLISDYLVRAAAEERHITPPDSAVAAEIRATPEFQDESGNFSLAIYNEYASEARRLESEVRRSLQRRALLSAASPETIPAVQAKLAAYQRQQRVVQETAMTVTARFNIDEPDIAAYYSANRGEYQIREEADWEYILISAAPPDESLPLDAETLSLALAEIRETQDGKEQRKVRHIFIAGEDEDARARADDLAARARAAPDSFAELAREFSEDAGSAENGGDLGVLVRGDLPPAMDDKAFALEDGEIGEAVAVDGGFSILQAELLFVPAPIENADIESETLARQIIARNNLAEQAEELQEIAHINIGSLVSVAAAAGVTVQTIAAVPRNSAAADNDIPAFWRSEEILAQLFAEEILVNGETGPAVFLDDDTFIMARATRYQRAGVMPLLEVSEEIASRLAAYEQVQIMLESVEDGGTITPPENAEWSAARTVGFFAAEDAAEDDDAAEIDARTRSGIFSAALNDGLPAIALVPDAGIVRFFRIVDVINAPSQPDDATSIGTIIEESEQVVAVNAYLRSLEAAYDVYFDDAPQSVYNTPY